MIPLSVFICFGYRRNGKSIMGGQCSRASAVVKPCSDETKTGRAKRKHAQNKRVSAKEANARKEEQKDATT